MVRKQPLVVTAAAAAEILFVAGGGRWLGQWLFERSL